MAPRNGVGASSVGGIPANFPSLDIMLLLFKMKLTNAFNSVPSILTSEADEFTVSACGLTS